jgi:hypothetical protein
VFIGIWVAFMFLKLLDAFSLGNYVNSGICFVGLTAMIDDCQENAPKMIPTALR